MPRGRYRKKQWIDREHAILEALDALAQDVGFASVTMDDLADRVGISKATLYQHFDSKDAMIAQLIITHTRRFLTWLDSTASEPPVIRLRETLRYLMREHITPRGIARLGHDEVMPVFYDNADIRALHNTIIDHLTALIRDGQAAGLIAADIAPGIVIQSMLALSLLRPNSAQIAPETHTEHVLSLFVRSLRPDDPSPQTE